MPWLTFLCRSGPPCRPTINHRKPDVTGGADMLWDVDSSLLSNSAPLLGGGTTRAAAAAPPTAPSPAAPWRCRSTHSDLEASKWQVASSNFTDTIKQIWIHASLDGFHSQSTSITESKAEMAVFSLQSCASVFLLTQNTTLSPLNYTSIFVHLIIVVSVHEACSAAQHYVLCIYATYKFVCFSFTNQI